jgi:hypothetical protein
VIRLAKLAADRGDTAEIGDGPLEGRVFVEPVSPKGTRALEKMAGDFLAEIGPLGPWDRSHVHEPLDVLGQPTFSL